MEVLTIDAARPPAPLPLLDGDRLQRLAAYSLAFRDVFSRGDQAQRLLAYLHGLLGHGRKNIEAMAARVCAGPTRAAFAQALQHFISTSPWDAGRLLARYRRRLPGPGKSIWVVHDVVFPNK